IKGLVAARSRARPLAMQMSLRPERLQSRSRKSLLDIGDRRLSRPPIDVTEESRSSPAGLIDDIDGVAIRDEIIRPTRTAIRRAEEIRGGLAPAVHHDDGIGPGLVSGDLILHEHLADHDGLPVDRDVTSWDRERALRGDLDRRGRGRRALL